MKVVKKKIKSEYYEAVCSGKKKFELRKDEDDIQEGDVLLLYEVKDGSPTGRSVKKTATYVLRNVPEYGLKEGYCIISIV